jgi:hypothetical protein
MCHDRLTSRGRKPKEEFDMVRNKKYMMALLGFIAATGLVFAAETVSENANSQIDAANDTTSYTEATISFGSKISDYNNYPIDASNFEEYKYSSLTNISYNNMSVSMENCYKKYCYKKYSCDNFFGFEYNYKKNNNSLQIGHNIDSGTSAGSLAIDLSGCKYRSVSVYADTYYDSKNYFYSIPFSINGNLYSNDGSWRASSGATRGDVPQFDLYYCTNPQTSLTISVPGTSKQYDMIYITKIVFHLV